MIITKIFWAGLTFFVLFVISRTMFLWGLLQYFFLVFTPWKKLYD